MPMRECPGMFALLASDLCVQCLVASAHGANSPMHSLHSSMKGPFVGRKWCCRLVGGAGGVIGEQDRWKLDRISLPITLDWPSSS